VQPISNSLYIPTDKRRANFRLEKPKGLATSQTKATQATSRPKIAKNWGLYWGGAFWRASTDQNTLLKRINLQTTQSTFYSSNVNFY
jgi:hypothetical protein